MSAFTLPSRYPGLFWMSKFIGPYFPKTKYYVEPFSGLGRTAKYSRSTIMILNDKSSYANNQCRKKFSKAIITNEDFETCIKRWDLKDTFFLIDPPWRTDFYDGYQNKSKTHRTTSSLINVKSAYARKLGKYMTIKDRTLAPQLAFIDRTSKEYLEDLKRILPKIKGHYILTLENKMKFPSPYSKLLIHSHPKMFGFHPKTIMFSNKPLEIQIPQIIDYV